MERAAQVGCVIVTFSTLCQEAVFTPPWSLSTVATPCLLTPLRLNHSGSSLLRIPHPSLEGLRVPWHGPQRQVL